MLAGDLEHPGRLALALQARSTAAKEIIFTVTDERHDRWAHNLLLNLEELGLKHHLVIGSSSRACAKLHARLGPLLGCGFSSFLANGVNETIDRGLRAYRIAPGHVCTMCACKS